LYSLLVKSEREYRWIGRWFRAVTQSSNEREVDEPTIEIIPTAADRIGPDLNQETLDNEIDSFWREEEAAGLMDVEIDLSGLLSRQCTRENIDIISDDHTASDGDESRESSLEGGDFTSPPPTISAAHESLVEAPTSPPTPLDSRPWPYSYTQIGIVLLCLHSGFLNATTAHSSRHLYTTHITGTGTQFAIDISHSGPTQIAVNGGMLVCYFIGSALTGTVVKSDFYSINKSYLRIFIVGTCLLVLALAIHLSYPESYFFYLILAIFSGMQAALGCKIKGVIIRTTFMSGCATDLGASLGKMLRHGFSTGISSIKMLLPSMLAYMTGACIATLLYPVFGRYQIIVNIIAFASIGALHSYVLHFKME
jgi:uncharacterized membrane protein YoaK (UPF0700 family)